MKYNRKTSLNITEQDNNSQEVETVQTTEKCNISGQKSSGEKEASGN